MLIKLQLTEISSQEQGEKEDLSMNGALGKAWV